MPKEIRSHQEETNNLDAVRSKVPGTIYAESLLKEIRSNPRFHAHKAEPIVHFSSPESQKQAILDKISGLNTSIKALREQVRRFKNAYLKDSQTPLRGLEWPLKKYPETLAKALELILTQDERDIRSLSKAAVDLLITLEDASQSPEQNALNIDPDTLNLYLDVFAEEIEERKQEVIKELEAKDAQKAPSHIEQKLREYVKLLTFDSIENIVAFREDSENILFKPDIVTTSGAKRQQIKFLVFSDLSSFLTHQTLDEDFPEYFYNFPEDEINSILYFIRTKLTGEIISRLTEQVNHANTGHQKYELNDEEWSIVDPYLTRLEEVYNWASKRRLHVVSPYLLSHLKSLFRALASDSPEFAHRNNEYLARLGKLLLA